jgi:pimeloyl-ACP methyl ester carboxylesterase
MLTALADGRLLAERIGATPPAVIALHGWQRSGADFVELLAGLDAVAPNLPGFGATEEPPIVWGTEDYAELVAEAIAPFAPLVVVGHSFGGRVAVRLAAKHPELVSALVLTGVPLVRLGSPRKPRLSFRIVRALTKAHILPASALEKQRRKHGSRDYNAASGIMRGVMVRAVNENYADDLAALDLPVRMVWGEFDTEAPTAAGEVAAGMIRGATFRVVAGQGHLLDGALAAAVREETDAVLTEVTA